MESGAGLNPTASLSDAHIVCGRTKIEYRPLRKGLTPGGLSGVGVDCVLGVPGVAGTFAPKGRERSSAVARTAGCAEPAAHSTGPVSDKAMLRQLSRQDVGLLPNFSRDC